MPIPTYATYATLAKLRQRQQLNATTDGTSDDGRKLDKLREAAREIETECNGRIFQPIIESRTFDWVSALKLRFGGRGDLLSLTSVVDGAGVTVPTSSFIMQGREKSAVTAGVYGPWYGFDLNPTVGLLLFTTTPKRALTVTGTWGYHEDYASAWHLSGVQLGAAMTDTTGTTITTTTNDSTTYDAWGQSASNGGGTVNPGHLIQIDNEWMQVVRYISSTQLVVIRGANGSTAATHANNAPISIYEPPLNIRDACAEWAAYLLAKDGTDFGKTITPALGQVSIPVAFPSGLMAKLESFKKARVS